MTTKVVRRCGCVYTLRKESVLFTQDENAGELLCADTSPCGRCCAAHPKVPAPSLEVFKQNAEAQLAANPPAPLFVEQKQDLGERNIAPWYLTPENE